MAAEADIFPKKVSFFVLGNSVAVAGRARCPPPSAALVSAVLDSVAARILITPL